MLHRHTQMKLSESTETLAVDMLFTTCVMTLICSAAILFFERVP